MWPTQFRHRQLSPGGIVFIELASCERFGVLNANQTKNGLGRIAAASRLCSKSERLN
jgi:hypothetical protein